MNRIITVSYTHLDVYKRQPEYFEQVKKEVAIKKPEIDVSLSQYFVYEEGQCVQIMHKGSYDDEPESVAKMNQYMNCLLYTSRCV